VEGGQAGQVDRAGAIRGTDARQEEDVKHTHRYCYFVLQVHFFHF
jgi:hypothetical protein